jgi:GntR family histidine utilization transcriptional repressor
VIAKSRRKPPPDVATALETRSGGSVFHLSCVHFENDTPVQYEDRFVNPLCAPDFLAQSFERQTPSEYLLSTIPADEVEHTVDAVLPGMDAPLLKIGRNEPCLLLTRRTWSSGIPVTIARLLYPASRYRLSCRFRPSTARDRG